VSADVGRSHRRRMVIADGRKHGHQRVDRPDAESVERRLWSVCPHPVRSHVYCEVSSPAQEHVSIYFGGERGWGGRGEELWGASGGGSVFTPCTVTLQLYVVYSYRRTSEDIYLWGEGADSGRDGGIIIEYCDIYKICTLHNLYSTLCFVFLFIYECWWVLMILYIFIFFRFARYFIL